MAANKAAKKFSDTSGMEEQSHRMGWLALIAVLSIVGIALWFMLNGTDQNA